MNTLVKRLSATAATLFLLTATSMTSLAAEFTFNKIKISGHVKLEVVQGADEKIAVEGDYSSRNTSIKRQGYTLIIKSNEYEPLTIKISIKDLQRIDASGRVEVVTKGNLNLKYLQIFLQDQATANVKATTESMYTFLKGSSHLNLSGITQDHTLVMDSLAKLNMGNLVAVKTTTNTITEAMAWSRNSK